MSDLASLVTSLQGAGDGLEAFGGALVERFGSLNIVTAALLGGALLLDRALSHRARASWRIALYAPVALRVALPLSWSLHVAHAPSVVMLLSPLQITASRAADEPSAWHALTWHALAAVIYVGVAVTLATRAVLARVRLNRALADAPPAPGSHGDVPCPVVQHDDLGPMAVGLFAPRIVLPRRLLAAGEEQALACVLRHESAHLRRGDAWLSVGMQILAIVAWPVAPLWIAIARVRQLIELACDEAALTGADATERRSYGHALLDIAERSLVVAPLGAGELHFGSTLRARIEALASQRHWPVIAQALALSIAPVALLVACGGATATSATPTTSGMAQAGGDRDYGYEFDTDSQKAATTDPGAPAGSTLNKDGRIAPEVIQSLVRGHFAAFQSCYEAGLKTNPKLAGTVSVRFSFGDDGAIKDAVEDKSALPDSGVVALPDAEVVACVVGEFKKITFPSANTGTVTVVYPIQFAP